MAEHNLQETGHGNKPSNVFSAALDFWTRIDLPNVQKQLDAQGLEIKEDQKESLTNRKNLASKTKEFRKLPDDSKLQQLKSILKLYQNEIDSLTNKQKKIESYFFNFYRAIVEAPDPKPLLELSLDSVISTGEAEELKQEIDDLNQQLSKKADYDQLKERLLRTEQNSAQLLTSKLKAKEEEFNALIEEKTKNWEQKEQSLNKQLKEYKIKIEELRTSNEVTELQLSSQNSNSFTNDNPSILAELEIVSRDAEYSKQRILEVEKRNEDLVREISGLKNSEIENVKEEFTKKVLQLEGENSLLIAELDQARKQVKNLISDSTNKVNNLSNETAILSNEIKGLKEKLYKTRDYDEIKNELQFLRQIEFDDDDDDIASDGDLESSDDISNKTKTRIDQTLIKRNKTLNNELVKYRSEHDDLMSKINNLQQQLNLSSEEIEKLIALNKKLEEDLWKYHDASKFNDNMSLMSGMSKRPNEDSSILPIITKQRDRFRDRNSELEEEIKKQHNLANDLKRQNNQLKQDNEQLYERTRYLAATSQSRTLQPRANIDLENNNYRNSYESKLHPIEQFRIKEQERVSSRLSPFERIFILITRAVLATRTTRLLFLLYCIGLHVIVMFSTIHSTSMNAKMLPEVGMSSSTGGNATPPKL